MASALMTVPKPWGTRGRGEASQELECLPMYAGVPCWALAAPAPSIEDAEKAGDVFGFECARDERSLVAD